MGIEEGKGTRERGTFLSHEANGCRDPPNNRYLDCESDQHLDFEVMADNGD